MLLGDGACFQLSFTNRHRPMLCAGGACRALHHRSMSHRGGAHCMCSCQILRVFACGTAWVVMQTELTVLEPAGPLEGVRMAIWLRIIILPSFLPLIYADRESQQGESLRSKAAHACLDLLMSEYVHNHVAEGQTWLLIFRQQACHGSQYCCSTLLCNQQALRYHCSSSPAI